MTTIYANPAPKPRLRLVWSRDNPCYALEIKGIRVTRSSERECIEYAIKCLEGALHRTKLRLEGKEK